MTPVLTNRYDFSKSAFFLALSLTLLAIFVFWFMGYRPMVMAFLAISSVALILALFFVRFPLWVIMSVVVTFLDNVYFFPSLSSITGNIILQGIFFLLVSFSFLLFFLSPSREKVSFQLGMLEYLVGGYLVYCLIVFVSGLSKFGLVPSLSEGFWGAYACVFIFFFGIVIRIYSLPFMIRFMYVMLVVALFALFFKMAYWYMLGRYDIYTRMTGPFVQYFVLLTLLTVQRHMTLKKIPVWEYAIYPAVIFFTGVSRVRVFIVTLILSIPLVVAIDYLMYRQSERKEFLSRLLRLAMIILPLGGVGIIVSMIFIPGFFEMIFGRFEPVSMGKLDESAFARVVEIMYSIKILKQTSWLWGSGFGTPPYVLLPSHDNAFAFLAPYVGLFGFAYLTIIWIVAVWLGFRLVKKSDRIPVYERMFLPPIVVFLLGCLPYGVFQKSYPRPAVAFIGSLCMAMISYWHKVVKKPESKGGGKISDEN